MNKPQLTVDSHFNIDLFREVVEFYGKSNLVFVMKVAGFGPAALALSAPLGFGLVCNDGNTSVEPFKITEKQYILSDNYKVGLISSNPLIPNQNFYIQEFLSNVRRGYCNIYAETEDGYEAVHVTVKDIVDPEESKVKDFIENNWLLFRNYITN